MITDKLCFTAKLMISRKIYFCPGKFSREAVTRVVATQLKLFTGIFTRFSIWSIPITIPNASRGIPICGRIIEAHTTLAPGMPGAPTDKTTTENISENICAVFSSIPEILQC